MPSSSPYLKILLDMDGVLADFVGGASRAHGRPSPYVAPDAFGTFDMEKLWGISLSDFWAPTNNVSFWAELEKTHDADGYVALAEEIVGTENIAILTSPSQHESCFTGKKIWLAHHFPQFKNRIIFGSAKEFLASPWRILIDDRDRNVERFEKAGGRGILVPRAWNKGFRDRGRALEIVTKELK